MQLELDGGGNTPHLFFMSRASGCYTSLGSEKKQVWTSWAMLSISRITPCSLCACEGTPCVWTPQSRLIAHTLPHNTFQGKSSCLRITDQIIRYFLLLLLFLAWCKGNMFLNLTILRICRKIIGHQPATWGGLNLVFETSSHIKQTLSLEDKLPS